MQTVGAIIQVSVGLVLVVFRIILYAINYHLESPVEIIILNMISLGVGISLIAVGSFSVFSADQTETFDAKTLDLGADTLDKGSEDKRAANSFALRNRKLICGGLALALITVVTVLEIRSLVTLPIKTSLGDLVRIENSDRVATNEGIISPKSEETIYVLSFEGKSEFEQTGRDVGGAVTKPFDLPLVDSNGKEFTPVFYGSPTTSGAVSNEDIKFNGNLTAVNGKWVYVGRLSVPGSKLTLIYVVPKSASGLALKDGGDKHRI